MEIRDNETLGEVHRGDHPSGPFLTLKQTQDPPSKKTVSRKRKVSVQVHQAWFAWRGPRVASPRLRCMQSHKRQTNQSCCRLCLPSHSAWTLLLVIRADVKSFKREKLLARAP